MRDRPAPARLRRPARILLVAVPALALLTAVAVRDATAALAVAALGAVLAGFAALVSGASGRRGRRGAIAVLAVGGAGLLLGGAALGAPAADPDGRLALSALSTRAGPVAPSAVRPLAVVALAALPVKGPSPMTGYRRAEDFGPAWSDVDRNGCDTRNDVLRRDLTERTETRCRVLRGVLQDPYTGRTIAFVRGQGTSADVQIDHVVPLADAWRTGAQRLTQAQRVALANDPVNLYAVDGPTNLQKGDGDAATWLPKRKAFRCTYVAHQIAVKRTYGLWVTTAERAAMRRVLAACADARVPAPPRTAGSPSAAPAPAAPAPAASSAEASPSAAPSTAAPAGGPVVHPGAFCTPAGAAGVTESGTAVRCSTTATDDRARWRRPA